VHGAEFHSELRLRLKGSWRKLRSQPNAFRAELAGTVIGASMEDISVGDEVTGQVDITGIDLVLTGVPLAWPPPAIELRFSGSSIRTDRHQKLPVLDSSGGVLRGSMTSPLGSDNMITIRYSYCDMGKAAASLLMAGG
jgi:hypothetical protein